MFRFIPNPNKKDPINSLGRKNQVAIFRLRTNHIQLNAHLSRITKDHNPACPLCDNQEETVHHFLFECPSLQDLRARFLPLNPTRDNTLYSSLNQLQQTSSFYHEAMHRRMEIHLWRLDWKRKLDLPWSMGYLGNQLPVKELWHSGNCSEQGAETCVWRHENQPNCCLWNWR